MTPIRCENCGRRSACRCPGSSPGGTVRLTSNRGDRGTLSPDARTILRDDGTPFRVRLWQAGDAGYHTGNCRLWQPEVACG